MLKLVISNKIQIVNAILNIASELNYQISGSRYFIDNSHMRIIQENNLGSKAFALHKS